MALQHIAVLVAGGLATDSSARKKLERQVTEWRGTGIQVTLAGPVPAASELPPWIAQHSVTAEYRSAFGRHFALVRVCRKLLEIKPDCIYLRQGIWHPCFGPFFRKLSCFAEFNSLDALEYQSTKPALISRYHRFTRKRWCTGVRGAVALTREIAQSLQPTPPAVQVISNGIPNGQPTLEPYPALGRKPVLGMLVTGDYAWHGVDKLVALARCRPEIEVHIIGVSAGYASGDRPANVRFSGYLQGSELQAALRGFDVGVGTLALHRKGMNEACPLKVREYLGYGIPVILGYQDSDFSPEHEFVCQIENDDQNVSRNLEQIIAFAKSWVGRRVPREQLAFASFSRKEEARLNFIRHALEIPH